MESTVVFFSCQLKFVQKRLQYKLTTEIDRPADRSEKIFSLYIEANSTIKEQAAVVTRKG